MERGASPAMNPITTYSGTHTHAMTHGATSQPDHKPARASAELISQPAEGAGCQQSERWHGQFEGDQERVGGSLMPGVAQQQRQTRA